MPKLTRKKQIKLHPRMRKAILAEFGVTEMTVYNALNYRVESDLSIAIRKAALERYGAKVLITTMREMDETDL